MTEKKKSEVTVVPKAAASIIPELGFEKDVKREYEGDWFALEDIPSRHPRLDGIVLRVKVRSRHTKEYRRAEMTMQTKALRKREVERVEYGLQETKRLTAKYCLIDWELIDVRGELIDFSEERAMEMMTNMKYREFADFVYECIAVLQGDLDDVMEEDEGK